MKKKTATKKAVTKAGSLKVYTITIAYRIEDEVGSYIFPALTNQGAFKAAIEELKSLIKEDYKENNGKKFEPFPNSIKFISGDEAIEKEFEHYYNQFGDLTYIFEVNWNLTTTTIKGDKLTYVVEG